jgi:hypothetical protein
MSDVLVDAEAVLERPEQAVVVVSPVVLTGEVERRHIAGCERIVEAAHRGVLGPGVDVVLQTLRRPVRG